MGDGKEVTCGLIILNKKKRVLLQLRDDKPEIPYPNTWVIPGGHAEDGESPEKCIRREIKEEMGIWIRKIYFFVMTRFPNKTDYTFFTYREVDITKIDLMEGQRLRWFSEEELPDLKMGFADREILDEFFRVMVRKK